MTITTTKCGVWILDDSYKKLASGYWSYNPNLSGGEPGDRQLWSWGRNCAGALGDNTSNIICKSSPVQIPGTAWCDLAGKNHYLALKTDNTLWAWGKDLYGSLGVNTAFINASSPIQIPGTSWNDIAAGANHSLARKTDGTLWAWGWYNGGQLANNNNSISYSSPIQIPGTNWTDIAAGNRFSLGIKDSTLWAWGINQTGELGDGTTTYRSSPVQIGGGFWSSGDPKAFCHSLVRQYDGTLWAWGSGGLGQLGDGNAINRSSPVQVPGTWVDADVSYYGSIARKSDGTLWVWGYKRFGAIGNNSNGYDGYSSPIQIPGTSWNDISGGTYSNFHARKTDGTLWAWGYNAFGQLGDGTTIDRSSPVQIPGTKWGCLGGGSDHTIAIKNL